MITPPKGGCIQAASSPTGTTSVWPAMDEHGGCRAVSGHRGSRHRACGRGKHRPLDREAGAGQRRLEQRERAALLGRYRRAAHQRLRKRNRVAQGRKEGGRVWRRPCLSLSARQPVANRVRYADGGWRGLAWHEAEIKTAHRSSGRYAPRWRSRILRLGQALDEDAGDDAGQHEAHAHRSPRPRSRPRWVANALNG